jgi:hypothetical protein
VYGGVLAPAYHRFLPLRLNAQFASDLVTSDARQVCDCRAQIPVSSGGPTLLVFSTTVAAPTFYADLLPSTADTWPLYRAPSFVLLHWRASTQRVTSTSCTR